MAECFADDVLLDLQILVYEIGTIGRIGHNAADMGGGQHNHSGPLGIEKLFHRRSIEQIKLRMSASDKIAVASFLQVIPYC